MLDNFCAATQVLSFGTTHAYVWSKLVTLDKMAKKMTVKNMRFWINADAHCFPWQFKWWEVMSYIVGIVLISKIQYVNILVMKLIFSISACAENCSTCNTAGAYKCDDCYGGYSLNKTASSPTDTWCYRKLQSFSINSAGVASVWVG